MLEGNPTLEESSKIAWAKGVFPLERKIRARSYEVEIPMADWCNLTSYETEGISDPLYEILDAETPAHDIDYDGFLGNFIFFSLEDKYDTEEIWENIKGRIAQQLNKAHEFAKEQSSD